MRFFYKGRHRKSTHTGRNIARVSVAGIVGFSPLLFAGEAFAAEPTGILDAIEECESSGNENASNGSHFGLFQFDLGTWRSVGGTGNPMDATRAEQTARAEVLLSRRGTQPWDASFHCWGDEYKKLKPGAVAAKPVAPKKVVAVPKKETVKTEVKAKVKVAAPAVVPNATGNYTIKPGDTLSGIAVQVKLNWHDVYAKNMSVVGANPNLILPGEILDLH